MTSKVYCKKCKEDFESDYTPMARSGYCMSCRHLVTVWCDSCRMVCYGKPDGVERCDRCRHKGFMKAWAGADSTGGRIWKLQLVDMDPMQDEDYSNE